MTVSDRNERDGEDNMDDARDGQEAELTAPDVGALERSLSDTEAKAKEYLDGWQRERAAFANFRRRTDEERASTRQSALEDVVCSILPLLDDLARACDDVPAGMVGHPWVNGVCMVRRKFEKFLADQGVEAIEAEGCKFDPNMHEAITHEPSRKHEEGEVIGEVTKGYRLGDRILRCSVVRVAKGG